MANEHLSVKAGFTPQLHGVELVPPALKIVSWNEGTDAEIAAMLDAHYAGTINLHNIWNIGDTRPVILSAMAATGVGESHVEQEIELQLVNAGGKELTNGKECAFVVQQKDLLTQKVGSNYSNYQPGYMNSETTNEGGWRDCARRVWCNTTYREALPTTIRDLFKMHKNKSSQGGANSTVLNETEDYFALPCGYNIVGDSGSRMVASGEDTVHWTFYDTAEKRKKFAKNSTTAQQWWTRSVAIGYNASFCIISSSGSLAAQNPKYGWGLAPFGCI